MELSKVCKHCKIIITSLNGIKKHGESKQYADKCKYCFQKMIYAIKSRKFKQNKRSLISLSKNKFSWIMGKIKAVFLKLDSSLEKLER